MINNNWLPLVQDGEVYSRYLINEDSEVYDTERGVLVSQVLTGDPLYFYVNLIKDDGSRVQRRVNNIMAWTFLGNPPTPKHTSDHIDQDRLNNHISNIRWASKKLQIRNRGCTLWYNEDMTMREFVDNLPSVYNETSKNYIYQRLCKGDSLVNAKFSWSETINPTFKFKTNNTDRGFEYKGIWYVSERQFVDSNASVGYDTYKRNLKQHNLPIEESLHYRHDPSAFLFEGVMDNQGGHCNRLNISYERISTLIFKGMSFEEAVKQPVARINKYCINGEILTNKQIFEKFGINPRNANTKLSKLNKDLRATLQHYNVDTSAMTIYPCDGKIVMYNNPV